MTAIDIHKAINIYVTSLHMISMKLWNDSCYAQWIAGVRYTRYGFAIPNIPFTHCYFLSMCVFSKDMRMSIKPAPTIFINSTIANSTPTCSVTNMYNELDDFSGT